MQRDRLEGWMVKQIEQADLARETVIQLPSRRASTAPAKPSELRSPRITIGLRSPRLGQGISGLGVAQRPQSTPTPAPQESPRSPRERIRQRIAHHTTSPTRLESATAIVGKVDDDDSVARQWRLQFEDPNKTFQEDGKIDRGQVLKSPRRRDNEDVEGDSDIWEENLSDESLLAPWSMSREYILDYIRQSVMPTVWTSNGRVTGEWEAVPSADADGRYGANETDNDALSSFLTSLPPLSARCSKQSHSPTRSPTRGSASPRKSYRRPHPGGLAMAVPSSPRQKTPHSEERIQRELALLRADPKAWEAFQNDVKQYLDDQRQRQSESNKMRENKQRACISPRAPVILAERKRRHDERVERTQRHRELLIQREDTKHEAMVLAYRRRTQSPHGPNDPQTPRDVTTTVGYRRRKLWLLAITFAVATSTLQEKLLYEKQRQIITKLQTRAARVIQRFWKQWKWRHASKQTIVVYTWLRKCLWKLLFKMRCRRRRRHATLLQRFMLDFFGGSRETRNFNRMMIKWRGKVIVSQRLGRAFVQCTRARLAALTIWWDALDHERHRSQRQGHLIPNDEKGAERNALVSSSRGRLSIRQSSFLGGRTSPAPGASTSVTTATASSVTTPVTGSPLALSTSPELLSRRSVSTRHMLDQMDERLTTMQQVLTPIELQRLQQHHTSHVVKIAKPIKQRLLYELLTASRKGYIDRLTQYHEQIAGAGFAREVKLDDARAIVQGSGSWGAMLIDTVTGRPKLHKPVFQLFSGDNRRRTIEELIRRGVQLTLESDPDQRALVERQRQRRPALDVGALQLAASGAGNAPRTSSARKRESGTVGTPSLLLMPQQPMSGSPSNKVVVSRGASETVGRADARTKSTRKLTFAVPATIRESKNDKR